MLNICSVYFLEVHWCMYFNILDFLYNHFLNKASLFIYLHIILLLVFIFSSLINNLNPDYDSWPSSPCAVIRRASFVKPVAVTIWKVTSGGDIQSEDAAWREGDSELSLLMTAHHWDITEILLLMWQRPWWMVADASFISIRLIWTHIPQSWKTIFI